MVGNCHSFCLRLLLEHLLSKIFQGRISPFLFFYRFCLFGNIIQATLSRTEKLELILRSFSLEIGFVSTRARIIRLIIEVCTNLSLGILVSLEDDLIEETPDASRNE